MSTEQEKRRPGQPKKHRRPWNLSILPAVRRGIEQAAAAKGMKPSDYVNDHFSFLAIAAKQRPEQQPSNPQ